MRAGGALAEMNYNVAGTVQDEVTPRAIDGGRARVPAAGAAQRCRLKPMQSRPRHCH